MTETRSLHRKLVEIMDAIDWIKKGGRNEVQRYDYTRQADVVDAVRTELVKRKVTCVPQSIEIAESRDYESKSGGRQHFLLIRVDWVFTDAESGETLVVPSLGAGTDSGDKAPYKAMTGASKYAELLSFLIPTGDDPEKEPRTNGRAPAETNGRQMTVAPLPAPARTHDGGLVGVAQIGKGQADFELRQTPDGYALAFRLVEGKRGIKVIAENELAEALALVKDAVIGQRVTCWGAIADETFTPKDAKNPVTFQVMSLERIQTPELILPLLGVAAFTDTEAESIAAAVDAPVAEHDGLPFPPVRTAAR